jgi:hypothetical protein
MDVVEDLLLFDWRATVDVMLESHREMSLDEIDLNFVERRRLAEFEKAL